MAPALKSKKQPFDFGTVPVTVARNKFKYKSLSSWAVNIATGCSHACRFCYVPSVSTIKQADELKKYGVTDPDAQWGDYVILRPFDEGAFRKSVKAAEKIPLAKLNKDGNRAVIYCSTTDPYQVFSGASGEKQKLLMEASQSMVRRSLEIIRDESTLNVRILTRSPLAKDDFDIFKTFGSRLLFGMSLPTLNDKLLKIYEPKAPGVKVRLDALKAAKKAGLHVFVAMAPTYPDCDEADLRATLSAFKELDPVTIFHEPINIRAENVARIEAHAAQKRGKVFTEPLKTNVRWRIYSVNQLFTVQRLATELGLEKTLKLWPDSTLGSKDEFIAAREFQYQEQLKTNGTALTEGRFALAERKKKFAAEFPAFIKWVQASWDRVSDWPR